MDDPVTQYLEYAFLGAFAILIVFVAVVTAPVALPLAALGYLVSKWKERK